MCNINADLRVEDVKGVVRAAFDKVNLDVGISLWQGGLAANQEPSLANALAEREWFTDKMQCDWTAIPETLLRSFSDWLFHMDVVGLRFYLPAFVIGELERAHFRSWLCFSGLLLCLDLDRFPERRPGLVPLLNEWQRHSICLYLSLLFSQCNSVTDKELIGRALSFWKRWAKRPEGEMVSPSLEDDTTLLNKYAWIMRSDIRSLCAVTTGAMRREMKGWWWLREIGVDRYYTGPQKCALAKRVAEFARDAREEEDRKLAQRALESYWYLYFDAVPPKNSNGTKNDRPEAVPYQGNSE